MTYCSSINHRPSGSYHSAAEKPQTVNRSTFVSYWGTSWVVLLFALMLVPDLQAQRVEHCDDCDGNYVRPLAYGPLQGLRNLRRQLTCGGGGCGEVYFGEWISTPPDCYDPCCGDQFVGGAFPSRPFQWRPGMLLASVLFSGRLSGRFCTGDESSVPCGCDDCGTGHFFEADHYSDHAVYRSTVLPSRYPAAAPSAVEGCSSCSAQASRPQMPAGPRYAMGNRGVTPSATRYASTRSAEARYTQTRPTEPHYNSRSSYPVESPQQHVHHQQHRPQQTYTARPSNHPSNRSTAPMTASQRPDSHPSQRANLMREAANYGRNQPASTYR